MNITKFSDYHILYVFLLSCFVLLIITPHVVVGNYRDQENQTISKMTYADVHIELKDLDLSMRRVKFKISCTVGFNFNYTSKVILVEVLTHGSYIGMTQLTKVNSGQYSSDFQINETISEFSGYFVGGPETYPFDRYEFNCTLSFFTEVEISKDDVSGNYWIDWPLRAQFEGPLNPFMNVTQSPRGPSISLGCALNRPLWRGYATLMPLYLIFALIGFTALLKTDKIELTYRIAAYVSVFTSALAYNFSMQDILPPGRYYLSLAEALIYSAIGSLTIFMILTLISYRTELGRFFTDIVAGIFSIGLLSFLILTFYIAPYVRIGTYQYTNILQIEWTISALLFSGILVLAIYNLYSFRKIYRGRPKSEPLWTTQRLDSFTRWIYIIAFSLSSCVSIVTTYESSIGWIEPSSLQKVLIGLVGENFALVMFVQLVLTLMTFFFFYYVPRKTPYSWLHLTTDAFGSAIFGLMIYDFLAFFGLLTAHLVDPISTGILILVISFIAFFWWTRIGSYSPSVRTFFRKTKRRVKRFKDVIRI